MIQRRQSRTVVVGKVPIGGKNPVIVQSMTKTATSDVDATVREILELEEAGCQIIRVAVPKAGDAQAIAEIKKRIHIPIVADIHFAPTLAFAALEAGADKIRINPGNIKDREVLTKIARAAASRGVPMRIGVNGGSIVPMDIRLADRAANAPFDLSEYMAHEAFEWIEFFETIGFRDFVVSLKASTVLDTVRATQKVAAGCDYPLHLGVTHAGAIEEATIRSAMGIGSLLLQGIGDTIRVSIAGPPLDEIKVGREILKSLGLAAPGINLVACPSCGRSEIDLAKTVEEIKRRTAGFKGNMHIAVMGCEVNGPGESVEGDIGLVAGRGFAFIYKNGKKHRRIPEATMIDEFVAEVKAMSAESKAPGSSSS
ncbi:MAG: flavodoxin-dependent (E)-4-hydroxy-3-methylbut-2-enyl-diphosphate synthase [Planctomycetes bacterium]|nr:flavodoxin-dependent (E)-4-hydroxy-3-methylbut-2-enyl-diphosphate synthase [Planctomycetota bacterium]MBI3844462.1 flavodoxin-dependent (E)-4-hydroxy-3-methylbut-2-enyl-diphosphate synthase [Planctomycetota bacterium]